MTFPMNFWLLFAVCILVSSIGFKNYVWFISLGYGFSIAAEGLVMFFLYGQSLSLGTILLAALFVIYGCRLGGYLAYREFKMTSYNKNMKGEIKDKDLYIDIGADSKEEAEALVNLGDSVTFEDGFTTLGDGYVMGKALDDWSRE